MLKIGHEVVRPGRHWGDDAITIPVPEELETVPGIPATARELTGTPASIPWRR